MSDQHDDPQPDAPQPGDDQIGSVAEEATKLFSALADLARTQGGGVGGLAGDLAGDLAGQAAGMAQQVNEHLATGDAECRYCPVCRAVHAVRAASPEVKTHLVVAASSLLQAASGLLEAVQQPPQRADGDATAPRAASVQHIDLDDSEDEPR
ncbi:hypothetical protein KG112_05780 [Nocardioides sp. zg-ZUI104]|uniref:hypothetical protein n=1 Tax=Nocardioides faecalis TaxID=2803858 RepID=UPI001BD134DC|nr:hypothetical protein [Nocardioides faecalis]MBS4752317.1 hypothetical protein [Nocardioides faecalis]